METTGRRAPRAIPPARSTSMLRRRAGPPLLALAPASSLRDWMLAQVRPFVGGGGSGSTDVVGSRRRYVEKSERVLRSLAGKIVGGPAAGGGGRETIVVHPNFITVSNITVSEGETAVMSMFAGRTTTGLSRPTSSNSATPSSSRKADGRSRRPRGTRRWTRWDGWRTRW